MFFVWLACGNERLRAADPATEPAVLSVETARQSPLLDQAAAPVTNGFTSLF
jgi:hypothetical protein